MIANSFQRVPVLYKSVSGFALRSIRLGACCSLVDWRCCFCRLYWWIRGVDGHLVRNANFCVEELQTVYIIRFTSSQDIRYLDCRMYQLDSISYLGAQIRQDTRFFTYPSASEQDGYIWYPCAIGCRVHHVYKLALPVYLLASDPPNISWLSYVAWPWLLRRTHCAPAGCGLADDENENVAPVPMDWCRLDDSGRRSAYSSPLANLERWINCYLGDCSRFRCWYDLRPTHRCHSKRCSTPRFVNLLFVFN